MIEEKLKEINARVVVCQNYNFGMTIADRLAHTDAPGMVRALSSVVVVATALDVVEAVFPGQANVSAKTVADALRAALKEMK